MNAEAEGSVDLLVVGAGPVGLFAALSAARAGIETTIIDHVYRGFARGYATLLHPNSVRLLREVGVPSQVFEAGRAIHGVGIRVDGGERVRLELASPAVALPQSALEEALLALLRDTEVELLAPCEGGPIRQDASGVDVRIVRRELAPRGPAAEDGEWQPVESSTLRAGFVIGADGYDSRVRSSLGIEVAKLGETESFAMFEVHAPQDSSSDIELGFSDSLASAVVPLAGGRARLGFQLDSRLDEEPSSARLRELVDARAPFFGCGLRTVEWSSMMHFERRLVRRFGSGRVWLAGDAAHITSPLGAHSMNLGLSEAHDLVAHVAACRAGRAELGYLNQYGAAHQREWHKLLGYHVKFDVLSHAPHWLKSYASRISPVLPASGADLRSLHDQLGLSIT
jgi:2-polyprenyl-6-methoxyphenol hydroxylase-like FAD-dependent oxidoreductase